MKTFSAKAGDITRKWYLLDASEMPLGRLASLSASILLGKAKVNQTPHMDGGDYLVIINSDKLITTGNKQLQKTYYRHSGYPGGLRQRRLEEQMQRNSTEVVRKAIRGMLPDNKLRDQRLKRLKIYTGGEHEHTAQQPINYMEKAK
jgi:large subunit ribosomal protein L13